MAETMIERVGTAINHATCYILRLNRAAQPDSRYEVVKLSDYGETGVVGAYGDREAVDIIVDALNDESRARAAIAAMREPTLEMEDAGEAVPGSPGFCDEPGDPPSAGEIWAAMIDQALKGKER